MNKKRKSKKLFEYKGVWYETASSKHWEDVCFPLCELPAGDTCEEIREAAEAAGLSGVCTDNNTHYFKAIDPLYADLHNASMRN
jgi:hypothetical protein